MTGRKPLGQLGRVEEFLVEVSDVLADERVTATQHDLLFVSVLADQFEAVRLSLDTSQHRVATATDGLNQILDVGNRYVGDQIRRRWQPRSQEQHGAHRLGPLQPLEVVGPGQAVLDHLVDLCLSRGLEKVPDIANQAVDTGNIENHQWLRGRPDFGLVRVFVLRPGDRRCTDRKQSNNQKGQHTVPRLETKRHAFLTRSRNPLIARPAGIAPAGKQPSDYGPIPDPQVGRNFSFRSTRLESQQKPVVQASLRFLAPPGRWGRLRPFCPFRLPPRLPPRLPLVRRASSNLGPLSSSNLVF